MRQVLLVAALALAVLQVAVGATYLALSFFVGEIRGEGVVTDFSLSPEQTWIVAAGMAGACVAAVGLLQARRRPVEATAAVILGALPGIAYSMPPVVHPAVLLLPVGLLAVWMSQRSPHSSVA
ncbi:MAG: hypothetical protein ACUVV3_00360 [Dehalococcoidia bacterium]